MLPFLRFFLISGVALGAVTTIFITLSGSDTPMAQLTPVEREQLRNEIRHRDPDRGASGMLIEDAAMPVVAPAMPGAHGFKSGLSLEERHSLREQVRGVNPDLLLEGSGLSESVAVNESYTDGVSNPVIDRGGSAGSNR